MNPSKRKHCFEFLGYDFLIDEDFRVWLIEVNTNPYIGIPNEFIRGVLPNMLDDMLRITVDPVYPPRDLPEPERPNLFDLIYSESPENSVNTRRPISMDHLYPIRDLKQTVGRERKFEEIKQKVSRRKRSLQRQSASMHLSLIHI